MRKLYFLLVLLLPLLAHSQEPTGYYNNAENKTEAALKTALYSTISANYKDNGYDGLYTTYLTSDLTSTGLIWDMYSTCSFNTDNKCGPYSAVCDCYNREHSIPQSWFNEASPMKNDAFHVYPTDGKVNGQRSNFPFGECANGTSLGSNAKGKLGSSTFSGYSGTVFEPADEYKGDFARTYFYFATRYQNIMSTIGGESFNNTTYPSLSDWSINLFLKWHRQDPVSQKEINRNNAIYVRQKNRNPFIDHPELAEHIWGNKKGTNWSLNTTTEPTLLSPSANTTIDFGTVSYQRNNTKTILIQGINLTGNLTFTLSGANSSYFSLSFNELSQANAQTGNQLIITYNAPDLGTHNAILTITGGGITPASFNLTGTSVGCQDLNFSAPFSSTMVPFTQFSTTGNQTWSWRSADYGVTMSGYASSANNANEDWLISPVIDLSDYNNVTLSFQHTINKGIVANMQTENTAWISNNYAGGNPSSATWTALTIPTYPAGNDWTFVNSGNIIIPINNCLTNSTVAFKYISTSSASSTWEIKSLTVSGMCKTSSVNSNGVKKTHKVYANNKNVYITNLENEEVLIYDVCGKNIFAKKNNQGILTINSVATGIYFVKVDKELQKIIVN